VFGHHVPASSAMPGVGDVDFVDRGKPAERDDVCGSLAAARFRSQNSDVGSVSARATAVARPIPDPAR